MEDRQGAVRQHATENLTAGGAKTLLGAGL